MEKFFHKLEPIQCFIHMKAPRKDRKDERLVTLMFRMSLDGQRVRSAPDFVQTAFTGVRDSGESLVHLEKGIKGLEIEIWNVPKPQSNKPQIELESADVSNLAVKKIHSSKGDPTIVLTFEVVYPWDSDLWRFMGRAYATDVFLRFDASNASLFDSTEEEEEDEDDAQGELPVNGEDEETEEAAS